MKYIFIFLSILFVFPACRPTRKDTISDTYIARNTDMQKSKYEYLYYSLIDSIRNMPAPKERSKSKGLQRSELETSLARSIAYLDSLGLLHHLIENKDTIPQPVRVINANKYIYDTIYINRTDTVYKNKEVYTQSEPSIQDKITWIISGIFIGFIALVLFIAGINFYSKK